MGKRNWDFFWQDFLDRERLNDVVQEMNILDNENKTEKLCREVYEGYDSEHVRLDKVRKDFLENLDDIAHIHLSTSRVKTVESILRKIIVKRHLAIGSVSDPYRGITPNNYQDVLTDLVGVRIILSFRGNWFDIHRELLEKFPVRQKEKYDECRLLPHDGKRSIQAEWPKVYYAEGDDISSFVEQDITPKLHEKGYRSIHYTISYKETYIELQLRTIYDEAWSDVDHRYVYKQEANPSNEALEELSRLLCKLTNLSNDIGEQMKLIYDGEKVVRYADDSRWLVNERCKDFFSMSLERMESAEKMLKQICNAMITESNATE